ncbi:MAG: EAL domain-containing protein [Gammaproteobacteria bacterium]|jgi:diguanylate cyclase (GGDEF)-like protein|nr:EAL domain-containing protein [Gammaproteobacteria bacterium]MBT3721851.1 EAL domain-containing protein [Gammaproteobacteria bacterium]MBT4076827.1 EAL domain-containing protein [Gammaproteobacteria bacterium]MBT4194327.1 EAL domain-containing protein [Gammaproteobacteria bacterium]MBT4451185.1 EAL domain-containing protein [Gammaproteobacteria bacterium]
MSFYSRFFKSSSGFFFKVLTSLLLLNGITIAGIILISYTFTEASLTSQAQDRITQELNQLVENFKEEYKEQVNRTLLTLEMSSLIDEYLLGSTADKLVLSRVLERRLLQIQKVNPFYQSIEFIHADGTAGFGVLQGKRNFQLENLSLITENKSNLKNVLFKKLSDIPLLLSSGNMEWFMPLREVSIEGPVLNHQGDYILLAGLSKLDKNTGEFGGAFIIELNFQHFFSQLRNILLYGENPIWLLDQEGKVLFKPKTTNNKNRLDPDLYLEASPHYSTNLVSNDDGIIAYRDIHLGNSTQFLRVVFSLPKELLVQDFEGAFNFFTLVTIFSLVFSILLSFLLSRFLSHPYKQLSMARTQLSTAHRIAKLGHWEWDTKTSEIHLSDHALTIFGLNHKQNHIDIDTFISYVIPVDRAMVDEKVRNAITNFTADKVDHYLITEQGEERYVHQEIDVIHDKNPKVVGTIQDVTERRTAELRIRELAYHDVVTGLANRTLLKKLAESALIEATTQQKILAILFLDLDHFKRINDTLGHDAGDELLLQVSIQLRSCLRPTDTIGADSELFENNHTVARFGGDEFIILLTDLEDEQDIVNVAKRIQNKFDSPFNIKSSEIKTSCSIGISYYPAHGNVVSLLLRHADSAMYQAKASGRSQYAIYNEQLDNRLRKRQKMEIDLQNALKNEEFFLEFQPRINLQNKKLVSFEALLRWQHPEHGLICPDEFIMIAEEIGLIYTIGEWVIQAACDQLAQWQADYEENLGISINLSPIQFNSPSIVKEISSILKATGVSPSTVEFEITEQALINDETLAIRVSSEIINLGASLSIDDFGTGYSSLQQLRQLPVNILKIDQSFIKEMLIDSDDESIIRASIELGHSLGLKVVAEGVEEAEQVTRLKEINCDEVQGNYIGEPKVARLCTELLKNKFQS